MANLIDYCAAKILSQVKMGSDTVVYGRVNIDTYSPKVVKALLAGVPLGGTYASPASTGTTVTEADAAAIAGTIASVGTGGFLYANNPILGSSTFEERGMIANVSRLYDNSVITMSTDRQREEIIGKVTNITTVRPNYFTGIIVSQVVKDFPTGSLAGTLGQFDVGIDGSRPNRSFLPSCVVTASPTVSLSNASSIGTSNRRQSKRVITLDLGRDRL
jgi:hypothetical protein